MDALRAVIYVILGLIALGIIDRIVTAVFENETITTVGSFVIFRLIPILLMIYAVVTGNLVLIILVEAPVFIASLLLYSRDFITGKLSTRFDACLLIIPTAICLVGFIILNQVAGAVIMTVLGFFQLAALA